MTWAIRIPDLDHTQSLVDLEERRRLRVCGHPGGGLRGDPEPDLDRGEALPRGAARRLRQDPQERRRRHEAAAFDQDLFGGVKVTDRAMPVATLRCHRHARGPSVLVA
jgi:hypothetical protein